MQEGHSVELIILVPLIVSKVLSKINVINFINQVELARVWYLAI